MGMVALLCDYSLELAIVAYWLVLFLLLTKYETSVRLFNQSINEKRVL